jgi:hypothetical protein
VDTAPVATLDPWKRAFAEWLGSQFSDPSQATELGMACQLKGAGVSVVELRRLKAELPFQQALVEYASVAQDVRNKKSRQKMARVAGKTVEATALAIRVLKKQLKSEDEGQQLAAARALAPYMTLYGERLWPRKEEKEVNTHVRITLSVDQAARLDAPAMQVIAEEVAYEVISEEQVPTIPRLAAS